MAVEAMKAVFESALPQAVRLVALAIAWHADRDGGQAFPSVARLARFCGYQERAVQRALAFLRRQGVLVVESPQVTRADGSTAPAGGRHHTTHYRLSYTALAAPKPCPGRHPFSREKGVSRGQKGCLPRSERVSPVVRKGVSSDTRSVKKGTEIRQERTGAVAPDQAPARVNGESLPISTREREQAITLRRLLLGCQHHPRCRNYGDCIERMVLAARAHRPDRAAGGMP